MGAVHAKLLSSSSALARLSMVDEQELESMEFKLCGVLKLNSGGHFEFDEKTYSKNTTPGVYLWLRRADAARFDVMYAGKAGNGIATRMGQHIGGLRLAPAERIERIRAAFGLGDCLEVWFRQSAEISLDRLFAEKVSAYSTEEEALIARFSPQLNRAKPPSVRTGSRKDAKPRGKSSTFTALSYELTSANGRQRDLWEDALTAMTESHKQKIGAILLLLGELPSLRARWPTLDFKVVGMYTTGPMCNQSMLVFGELANRNFKKNSRVVYVSLDKELIAFSPEVTQSMPAPPDVGEAYSLDSCLRMLTS
jgi:hypothetical protein